MKKTRLLIIALLVMLVAASGYAQDSYRQAVKDYLTASEQLEKGKSMIQTLSMLFEKSDQVDIDQLTKRFIDERYEDTVLGYTVPTMQANGVTEADLKELTAVFVTPEYKAFNAHFMDWMVEFSATMMAPIIEMGEQVTSGAEYKPVDVEHLVEVQPRADIDAAYADKFNRVILNSSFAQIFMDAMMKKFNEASPYDSVPQKTTKKEVSDKYIKAVPIHWLNSAYGILTLEDLDFAEKLFANDAYRKLQFELPLNTEYTQNLNQMPNYIDWMKQQGATVSEDPNAMLGLLKSMLNLDDLDLDNINADDLKPDE